MLISIPTKINNAYGNVMVETSNGIDWFVSLDCNIHTKTTMKISVNTAQDLLKNSSQLENYQQEEIVDSLHKIYTQYEYIAISKDGEYNIIGKTPYDIDSENYNEEFLGNLDNIVDVIIRGLY